MNSTLEYNVLIDSILLHVMGQMRVLKAGLFAKKGLDSAALSLHRNYKGFEIEHGVEYSIAEDHPVISLFSRQCGCYTINDIAHHLGSLDGLEGITALAPSLVVPLKAKGTINGLLVVGDKIGDEDFDVYEREYALNLASLAAVAINNAYLFEMTTTDMMTRLKMKHYFYSVLIERMSEAGSSREPLSVIMLDIDFFKKVNDTYGHSFGDAVLKNVAHLVQSCIRTIDLAARYGGEEFCVLLPGADLEKTRSVAERIRTTVAEAETSYENRTLSVTVSLGVAQYDPERDHSAKSLIDRADQALYISKQNGRNQVSVSE